MKAQCALFLLIILGVSCKIREKHILGDYVISDEGYSEKLQLNPDHTFIFESYDESKYRIEGENIDSCRFINRGTWKLTGKHLVLNSFGEDFTDTTRSRIKRYPSSADSTSISLKDAFGSALPLVQVYDEKGILASAAGGPYYSIKVNLADHKIFVFFCKNFKPEMLGFFIPESQTIIITLSPIYKAGVFKNKKLAIDKNQLSDSLQSVYHKVTL